MDVTLHDLALIGILSILEGLLSIDNALVLAMMARHLPKEQQKKALTYGLVGAVVFRIAALGVVTHLIRINWIKFVGGGYLLFLAAKYFFSHEDETDPAVKSRPQAGFWKTVFLIELLDIAFAVDSILAAVALTNKFWVIFAGGMIGVIMMRGAANLMIELLASFPRFETSAYLLVTVIGLKVIIDGLQLPNIDFHSRHSPAFWILWTIMAACVIYGFKRSPKQRP